MRLQLSTLLCFVALILFGAPTRCRADSISSNPIVFVTMVPNPADFGTLAATFGNHIANPNTAFRGGDLWIRYSDGTLRNLTAAAGYGNAGFQGASAIAVRDPAVHWDGNKILFSMIIGAATQRYQVNSYRWQLYEITGFGPTDTPVITKVPNQPTAYNNISPTYASDDTIIFSTDRPRDDSVLNTYPQRDEYESSPVVTGLWKLDPSTGALNIMDHSPSGDFNPIIDSFGRIVFTRWDHLQRDQQNVGGSGDAFNYESEVTNVAVASDAEIYPEPRSNADPDKQANVNLFTINQFFPWAMNQDGTDLETLQHVGRQEIGLYSERSFNDDPNVEEFYGQYDTGDNDNEFTIFLHIKEDPIHPGTYFGVNCQEFGTHTGGQIVAINGAPGTNPDHMTVSYLTHPDTAGASDTPSGNHTGLYRDPVPLTNGNLIATHTSNTRQDANIGTSANPLSRYDYRLKLLTKPGAYFAPSTPLTSGISKSVNFWSPDELITYNGPLWEMMAVEVRARTRPTASTLGVPAPEAQVLNSLGISVAELTNYLRSQNLALIVTRNATTRDRNDRQQPTNLRVAGTSTQSLPKSGKIYDISHLEMFQGDLIRGYGTSGGRRVLAQRLHSINSALNPTSAGAPAGSVQIASDGSIAAFVPARRALTWQLSSPSGAPVVRERYWVTFQPGEIRVCASCHGVNTADHLGNTAPTNPPQALANLLANWRNLPQPFPTPTPGGPNYSLTTTGRPSLSPGGRFQIVATGNSSDVLKVRASVNGQACSGTKSFAASGASRTITGKFPKVSKGRVAFALQVGSSKAAAARSSVKLSRLSRGKSSSSKDACKALMKSLKASS